MDCLRPRYWTMVNATRDVWKPLVWGFGNQKPLVSGFGNRWFWVLNTKNRWFWVLETSGFGSWKPMSADFEESFPSNALHQDTAGGVVFHLIGLSIGNL
ncbi:MAG: hypothetical protein NXI08_17185 [bacterium]|nr:hypothetical protein [bacterium]